MLYAKTINKFDEITEFGWHVGAFFEASPYHVFEIQADCDELIFIKYHCRGIRLTDERVIRWYGDEAKFIAGFLSTYSPSKKF